jgi:ADP-ribosylglycohydrolase
MLPSFAVLRHVLASALRNKADQGHVTEGLSAELDALPDSYDALNAFAARMENLPQRDGWPYVEPNDWEGIVAECDPSRPLGRVGAIGADEAAARVEAAFLGRVAGCMLGKPLEISPTLAEIKAALERIGEWPLNDYVSERIAPGFTRGLHHSWRTTCREHQRYVTNDDDMNYAVIGLLVLEKKGIAFTRDDLLGEWKYQLPLAETFGPERLVLAMGGLDSFKSGGWQPHWVTRFNPREEFCGALIRADAYGWACPGRPALAAELAWKDAGMTHLRSGIYGSMFVAAALALAAVERDPLRVFEGALQYVPQRSRFAALVRDSLAAVRGAGDWLEAYARIHGQYGQYGHCMVLQEVGTLINTLCFARSVGDGICKQVMQGNDTDSFGATAGSLLGMFFGPGHLEDRWLAPFHDEMRLSLAQFWERSLSATAQRAAALPARVEADLRQGVSPRVQAPAQAVREDAAAGVVEKSPCRG